jgi:hypothetical protein
MSEEQTGLSERGFEDLSIRRVQNFILPKIADVPRLLSIWKSTLDTQIAETGDFEVKAASRQQQFQQPGAAHYWDHFFDPWANPNDGEAHTVELARFPVPSGNIGIVRKLYQWTNGNFCSADDWGNPFKNDPNVDDIIWHLRLTPFIGAQGARWDSTEPFLPGIPYQDLPFIRYLWHLPHAAGHDLNLIIPSGWMLRLIARVPILVGQWSDQLVMGRLTGYWQSSEYCSEATMNSRKGF